MKRSGNTPGTAGTVDPSRYQGRRWVTRQHLHIDRLACIWLVKRFVDRRGRFFFVASNEETKGGIAFDMFSADLTRHGEDRSFETMLERFGLRDDPGLCEIEKVVHDIDLKDRKFTRKEAAGLDAIVTGLGLFLRNDQRLNQQATGLFDGLYALLGRRAEKNTQKRLASSDQRPSGRPGARNQKKKGI